MTRLLSLAALGLLLAACGPAALQPSPSASTTVSEPTTPAPIPTATAVPTVQGLIAFSKGHNIWVYGGSSVKQITTLGSVQNPAWSPDGTRLAFDRAGKNSADLYLMSYPGGEPQILTSNSSPIVENNFWEMQPAWTPDGRSLLYASDRGRLRSGTLDLAVWRITLATKARAQLTEANLYTGGVDYPSWRPGSAGEILYTSWTYLPNTLEPYGALLLLDTRTGTPQPLTASGETAMQASWSPDGQHLALIRRDKGQDQVWISGLANGAPTPAATREPSIFGGAASLLEDGVNAHPVWSPDGHAIAYIGLVNGSFDLFVQALTADLRASGSPRPLTQGQHLDADSAISWSH